MVHFWKEATVGVIRANYKIVQDLEKVAVGAPLMESVKKGQAATMAEAEAKVRYGNNFVIAFVALVMDGHMHTTCEWFQLHLPELCTTTCKQRASTGLRPFFLLSPSC